MKRIALISMLAVALISVMMTGCKKTEIDEVDFNPVVNNNNNNNNTVIDNTVNDSQNATIEGEILIVTDPWPPYIIENDDGTFTGFHTEVLREVLKELKIPSRIVKYPWERCIQMIKDKTADAIFTLNRNAEREEFMYFPETSLAYSPTVFFTLKGRETNINYSTFDDLKGLRIGVVRGYSYSGGLLDQNYLTFDVVNDEYTNIKKLVEGRVDLWPADRFVGIYRAKVLEDLEGKPRGFYTNRMGYLAKELNNSPVYIGFSMKAGNDVLARRINEAIIKVRNSVAYKRIEDSYTQ